MPHITFVTGDMKPGVLGAEIAKALQQKDATLTIFATNPSARKWLDEGFEVIPVEDLDVAFRRSPPDVIVSGISSSKTGNDGLEITVGQMARTAKIPIVFLDDDWGCFNRRSTSPDLYLTIDKLGEQMIRKARPGVNVAIMGDDAVNITPDPEVVRQVQMLKSRGKTVVLLYGNKDPRTEGAVAFALESLKRSLGAVIVPKFHPGAHKEFKGWCQSWITSFAAEFPDRIQDMDGHSDHIAAVADITIGVGGTGMRVACHHGRTPILTWTTAMSEMLQEETGASYHALVQMEVALGISLPIPFEDLLEMDKPLRGKRAELFSSPTPFNPEAAADHILALVR